MEEDFNKNSIAQNEAKRRAFEERAKVINLFIWMSFSTIGFSITQIIK